MSAQLFKKLQKFRKDQKLSIHQLTQQLGAHYTTYHRWKKSNKITGPYKKIVEEFLEGQRRPANPKSPPRLTSDIAVIGAACWYPGADNLKALWENILSRRVQFRRMLDQRLPLKDYYDEDPKSPDKMYLTKAAFIDGFNFDWAKLRIPRKTFESTDIVHWLALDTALKTFEDAGYQLNKIPLENTGVILGNTLTGEQTRSLTLRMRWPYVKKTLHATLASFGISEEERGRLSEEMEKVYKSAFFPITEDSLAGGLANTIAGRICNYLNLKGGGYIVDGACSSSLLAVSTAANALKLGEMDLALAGGVDISLDPFELVGFSKAGALAKDQMRVYDQKASGFIPGEGCGFVLLKRLEDAVRDKDYIYSVIKGWGISSDGKGGIMEPSSSGQAAAIQRAYKLAGYTLADVDFVEGHGTGTTKGDKVELGGIAAALKQGVKKIDRRVCGVTSFKSIVGHTKAAAGIGGFIKGVLAVNQRVLPPTANCHQPNEIFEDEAKQLYPLVHGKVYPSKKTIRAGVSSAGFGGINCHITIESGAEPTKKVKSEIEERALFASNQGTEVFVFASRTISHLLKLIQKFKEDLRNISMAEMADLSARLNNKVKAYAPIKAAIVTDSPEHLYDALCLIEQELKPDVLAEGKIVEIKSADPVTYIVLGNHVQNNRIGFLYSGQGSQRLNMTRTLVERFDWARDLLKIPKLPLGDYIYKSEDEAVTNEEKQKFQKTLSQTEITQPAVTFSSCVWTEFLSKMGVEPEAVGGHSLGELTAFYKAGAFDSKTLLKFSGFRGQQMSGRRRSAGMVSLFCDYSKAESIIKRVGRSVVISNMNSPAQTVVSGALKDIEKVIAIAKKENISTLTLPVSNAFHSSFMNPASKKIASTRLLNGSFKPTKINLFSCVTGGQIKKGVDLRMYFSDQVLAPVNFIKLVESMSEKCDLLIEVGPGRILTDLVKAINEDKESHCFPVEGSPQNDRDLNIVLAQAFVRNIKLNWRELYRNRVIKPFVPASRRKFIENQCERPLRLPESVSHTGEDYSRIMKEVAQAAMIPARADEETVTVQALEETPHFNGEVSEALIHFVEKLTGFNKDSLQLDLRLLDDLNLDSIKAAELIAEVGKALGVSGEIEPAQYSNRTLDEIRQKFEELVACKEEGKGKGASQANILKRYSDKVWVRNFIEKFERQDLSADKAGVNKTFKDVLIICEAGEKEIAGKVKKKFKTSKVRIASVDDAGGDKKWECVIAILSSGNDSALTVENLHQRMEKLSRIISVAGSSKDVVFAQLGSGDFKEGDIRALASTLHLERPDLRLRIIDFNKKLDGALVAENLQKELTVSAPFTIAGYNAKGERHVPVFSVSNPAGYKKRDIEWSKKDVVIVTGGAKGITAECALEFGRMTRAKMVLIGRSKKDSGIEKILKRFQEEHLTCEYYSCDVTDAGKVKGMIKDVEKQFGPVTAIIHGAGLNSLRRLKQTKLEDVYSEALPKVMGAVNILETLEGRHLKLFAAMTSIIGVTGMEGSGWYGFANETLVQYLRDYKSRNKGTQIIASAFSVWDEVGMGVKLGSVEKLSERGIGAIPVAEGVRRFKELIERDPKTDQVIITSRVPGLDTFQTDQVKPDQDWRFIDEIKYYMPQVELIAHANLNINDDPYVLDHNWKGSLLFPLVFGLEAMAQAAAYLTNRDHFKSLKIRNIKLERPIPVSRESGTVIEIHAQVLEREEGKKNPEVKVEIYSEQTGFHAPHFSAVIELDAKFPSGRANFKSKANNVLDIDPSTDLYGPVLFQGKMFQCIDKLHELSYNETTHSGECVATVNHNKFLDEGFDKLERFNAFLLDDPFFIDSVLQSMQIIISQDISLPQSIDEIELTPSHSSSKTRNIIISSIRRMDEDHYRGDAEVSRNGFILRIGNCCLKVLETLPDNPSANDLVNPAIRDQKIIDEELNRIAKEFDIDKPFAKCFYDDRLRKAKKKKRHQVAISYIKETINEFLKKKNLRISEDIKIDWLVSGRPVVKIKGIEDLNVSLSHVENLLICVVGYGEQGCDVEGVKKRTYNDWVGLLGKEKKGLLDQLVSQGANDKIDQFGTIIWGANEAAKKILDKREVELKFVRNQNGILIFSGNGEIEKFNILSFPISLNNGLDKILSLGFMRNVVPRKVPIEESSLLTRMGYNEETFKVKLEYSGPQEQLVFIKRQPVAFKFNRYLNKTTYFTSYFDWMGEIREHSANPIINELSEKFENNNWGIATKFSKLEILGFLKANDILETHFWSEKVESNVPGTYDLCIDWKKITPNGSKERVALSRQRIVWVKVLSRSEVKIEKLPSFIENFMDIMRPRSGIKKPLEDLPEYYRNLNRGKMLISYKTDVRNKGFLEERTIFASLEHSNLIGNIYFSNYARWAGELIDSYLFSILPDFYQSTGNNGELVCTNCEINHLNEGMPFDNILIKMSLDALYANGVDLILEYFLIKNNNKSKKLAMAKYEGVWIKNGDNIKNPVCKLPPRLINALIRKQ